MPAWLDDLRWYAVAAVGIWMLSRTIWWRGESGLNCILAWGPGPNRTKRFCGGAFLFLSALIAAYTMRAFLTWPKGICSVVLSSCLGLSLMLSKPVRNGIYETGLLIPVQFRFRRVPMLIQWAKIRQYQWADQGTLIVNPGWRQMVCDVPEAHIADVDAMLDAKCQDRELEVPGMML